MPTKKNLPQPPANVTVKAISSKGYDMMFTLRDEDELELLNRLGKFFEMIENTYHVRPTHKPSGNGEPQPQPPPTTSEPKQEKREDMFFDAVEMVHGSGESWKVKGGKYMQHGVTVWPEVLRDAGFDPDGLDTKTTYNLDGFTAYYHELTEKGHPKKIAALTRG